MEGRQGGDLDPGTGRDTQVTEAGGAFDLFIYLFSPPEQLWNARRSENRWLRCDDCQDGLCQMSFIHVHSALKRDLNLVFP